MGRAGRVSLLSGELRDLVLEPVVISGGLSGDARELERAQFGQRLEDVTLGVTSDCMRQSASEA